MIYTLQNVYVGHPSPFARITNCTCIYSNQQYSRVVRLTAVYPIVAGGIYYIEVSSIRFRGCPRRGGADNLINMGNLISVNLYQLDDTAAILYSSVRYL